MKTELLKRFRERYDYYFYKNEFDNDMICLLDKYEKRMHKSNIKHSCIYIFKVMDVFELLYYEVRKENRNNKIRKQRVVSDFYKEKQKYKQ